MELLIKKVKANREWFLGGDRIVEKPDSMEAELMHIGDYIEGSIQIVCTI